CLIKNNPLPSGDRFQHPSRDRRVFASSLSLLGNLIGKLNGLALQPFFRSDFVDETQLSGFASVDGAPGEDQVQRFLQSQKSWQPLCSTPTRQHAKQYFRKTDLRLGIVAGHAVITRQRKLRSP